MPICQCIMDDSFDFYIDVVDSNKIMFQDLSKWSDEDGFDKPDSYDIEIIRPGRKDSETVTVSTAGYTNLAQHFNCQDGVYCFELSNCGSIYRKQIGIFSDLECCIKKAAINGSSQELQEARKYLELTKASIEFDNLDSAQTSLKMAKSIVKNLSCDCGC